MHFLTIKEALDFIQAHQIDGSIIKDLSQERLKRRKMSKQYHEDYGDVITYLYNVMGNSSDKMLQAAHDMNVSVTSLSKFMRDPYSLTSQTRDKIVANITRIKKED
nr:MAG TPA: Catabolite control protein A [Caudoviricetes sp.]